MLKKGIAILLVLVHLISAMGVNARVHFCGSNITQFNLSGSDNHQDCACVAVKKTDCCSDVTVEAKIITEATTLTSLKISKPFQLTNLVLLSSFTHQNLNYLKITRCIRIPLAINPPLETDMLKTTIIRI